MNSTISHVTIIAVGALAIIAQPLAAQSRHERRRPDYHGNGNYRRLLADRNPDHRDPHQGQSPAETKLRCRSSIPKQDSGQPYSQLSRGNRRASLA